MAGALWTSLDTGYRRRGTKFSELHSLVQAGIITSAIAEPLQCCPANAPATEMRKWLDERGFDVAGVKEVESGPTVGFVAAERLTDNLVSDHIETISADLLISESAPLASLLEALVKARWKFVLVGEAVDGIVTRADLNKPPVRLYLFGLVSLLEMHLTYWLKRVYGPDPTELRLSDQRVAGAMNFQRQRRQRGEDPSLIDCLQFCDKRDLVLRSKEACSNLGLGKQDLRGLNQLERLRDILAHSQEDLAAGSSWSARLELVRWAEEVVTRSEARIEELLNPTEL